MFANTILQEVDGVRQVGDAEQVDQKNPDVKLASVEDYRTLLFIHFHSLIPIFFEYLSVEDIAQLLSEPELRPFYQRGIFPLEDLKTFEEKKHDNAVKLFSDPGIYQALSTVPFHNLSPEWKEAGTLAREICSYFPREYRSLPTSPLGMITYWSALGGYGFTQYRGLIYHAVFNNDNENAQALVRMYPNLLEEFNNKFGSPAQYVVKTGKLQILRIFLLCKADPNVFFKRFNYSRKSAFEMFLLKYGVQHLDLLNLFLDKAPKELRGSLLREYELNEHFLSTILGRDDKANFILEPDMFGNFIIHRMVCEERLAKVQQLLEIGLHLHAFQDRRGLLPIYHAIKRGFLLIANVLAQHMANDEYYSLDCRLMDGLTQIDLAVMNDDLLVAAQLQKLGADANTKNRKGQTTVEMIIAENCQRYFGLVFKLMKFGVISKGYDKNFLSYVLNQGHFDLLPKLHDASKATNQSREFLQHIQHFSEQNFNLGLIETLLREKIYFRGIFDCIQINAKQASVRLKTPLGQVGSLLDSTGARSVELNVAFEELLADIADIFYFNASCWLVNFCCHAQLTEQQQDYVRGVIGNVTVVQQLLTQRRRECEHWLVVLELMASVLTVHNGMDSFSRVSSTVFHFARRDSCFELTLVPCEMKML